jgi:hypothetical protein
MALSISTPFQVFFSQENKDGGGYKRFVASDIPFHRLAGGESYVYQMEVLWNHRSRHSVDHGQ